MNYSTHKTILIICLIVVGMWIGSTVAVAGYKQNSCQQTADNTLECKE